MRLLRHLISSDGRRFKLAIAIWIAIVAAESALDAYLPRSAGHLPTFRTLTLAVGLLWLARVLLLVVLVPMVVQTHPLVGSDAFWMTRPIPPRTLLLSKLMLLSALFLIVPLVADIGSMATYHVPPGDVTAVVLQNTLWRSMVLLLLMCGAAITRNLARFAILGGGVLLGLAVLVAILGMVAWSRVDDYPYEGVANFMLSGSSIPVWRGTDETAGLVGSVLLLAAGLALLLVQYRSRSGKRSVPVALGGIVAAWLVTSNWSWPLIQRHSPTEPGWARSSSALRLSADPKSVLLERQPHEWPRPRTWRVVRADVRVTDAAPDWLATTRLAVGSLELDTDARLSSRGYGYPATLPSDRTGVAPFDKIVKNVLGVEQLLHRQAVSSGGETAIIFVIRGEDLAHYHERTRGRRALARYRGDFVLDLWHIEVAAALPLERDATFQEGAYRIRIDEIVDRPDGPAIRVTSSNVSTMFDRAPRPSHILFLRNNYLREAVGAELRPMREPVFLPFFGMSGVFGASTSSVFASEAYLIRPSPGYGPALEQPQLDPNWILGAELIVLRMVPGGSVRRTLEIDGVLLAEAVQTR